MAFGQLTWDWRPALWGVAILTMVVGSIIAITQTDVKRLLAYSSIAQAGFILTGGDRRQRGRACPAACSTWRRTAFTTIGAFAVVTLVRDQAGEAAHLSSWAGLGKRSPLVAGVFAFFLLAFAGIPLTSGFTGKFAVFQAAIAGGAAAAGHHRRDRQCHPAFFYVRVIVLMFFSEPGAGRPRRGDGASPLFTGVAVAVGAIATLVFGIVPEPLLSLANHAASQLFVR